MSVQVGLETEQNIVVLEVLQHPNRHLPLVILLVLR